MGNSYNTKNDILKSFYPKYQAEFCRGEDIYFVTITPNKNIYTEAEARTYLAELIPNATPFILVLENNDNVAHFQRYKEYGLLPTAHIHILIGKSYLQHFKELVFYENKKELKLLKRQHGGEIHAVATCVYDSDGICDYLSKQCDNNFTPLMCNLNKNRSITNLKETVMKVKQKIDLLLLYQFIVSGGHSYSEVKHFYRKQKIVQLELLLDKFSNFVNGILIEARDCFNRKEIFSFKHAPFLSRGLIQESFTLMH
ncbi:MAG TPA: hypothetical protein VNZ49_11875 [Bacteroidia bacterium]|jgi:hypothetical protein|nr:hypothetical protein [Bacteroidia bacterium]